VCVRGKSIKRAPCPDPSPPRVFLTQTKPREQRRKLGEKRQRAGAVAMRGIAGSTRNGKVLFGQQWWTPGGGHEVSMR
jgi:hypothetical protein